MVISSLFTRNSLASIKNGNNSRTTTTDIAILLHYLNYNTILGTLADLGNILLLLLLLFTFSIWRPGFCMQ